MSEKLDHPYQHKQYVYNPIVWTLSNGYHSTALLSQSLYNQPDFPLAGLWYLSLDHSRIVTILLLLVNMPPQHRHMGAPQQWPSVGNSHSYSVNQWMAPNLAFTAIMKWLATWHLILNVHNTWFLLLISSRPAVSSTSLWITGIKTHSLQEFPWIFLPGWRRACHSMVFSWKTIVIRATNLPGSPAI